MRLICDRPYSLIPAALLSTVMVCAVPAFGQSQSAGAAQLTPIDADLAPRPGATAVRATGPIRIDGTLDEGTWAAARVIDEFFQQKPDQGMPASERTEVRILFDDENLYVGAELHDQPGYEAIIPTLQRDPNTRDGDAFAITLDPFLDGKTVFSFFFNPGGAVRDLQTADDGRINNSAWDAAFDVEIRVHDAGWTLELAIPWSQLRFDPARDEQVWGMNLLRRIRRKNEDATWAPMDRQWQLYVISRGGTLRGLDGLQPGRNLSVKPWALTADPSGVSQVGADTEFDAGLDLKYGITPGVTLDLTLNTDFSQVEVDQEQVNLTRFSLFFPEKREFFLENAGVFQFGDQGNRQTRSGVSNRDFTLFHSRRVGLTPSGTPLPILGGGRVSGTAGPFTVGLLNVQTRSEDSFNPENFTVARVRSEAAPGLNLGGIFVNRSTTSGGPASNRSFGVDADLQAMNGYLLVQSYLAGTEGTLADGSAADLAVAGRLSVGWKDPFWEGFALFRTIDEDFDPGVGFIRRRGVRHSYGSFGVRPRVDRMGVQDLNPYVEVHNYTDHSGELETREVSGGVGVSFLDGGMADLTVTDLFERVDVPFSIRGREVAPGDYDFQEASASYTASGARVVSGSVNVSTGGYYGGDRRSVGGSLLGRIGHQFLLNVTASHNRIDLPGQAPTTVDVYGANLNVFFSTRLMTSAFVQYNEASQEVVTNVRLRWIHAPLSDLYLVLTERRDTNADQVLDRFLTLKVTKLLAF